MGARRVLQAWGWLVLTGLPLATAFLSPAQSVSARLSVRGGAGATTEAPTENLTSEEFVIGVLGDLHLDRDDLALHEVRLGAATLLDPRTRS
jgi:hypothetical protein